MATAAKKRALVRKDALHTAIRSTATAVAVNNEATAPEAKADEGLISIARDLRSWADIVLGVANTAADLSLRVANSRLTKLSHKAAVKKAESVFRSLRESAGLTLKDIGKAINLEDLSLLEAVEGDKVGLPFEVILRLAGVLGRNDPIPVAMKLTRSYNPRLWKTLEALGLGRLAVEAGREREFDNIYRASDTARQLNDAEFAAALKFVRASFEAALVFRRESVGGQDNRAGQ